MKITKTQLKQIIKEEVNKTIQIITEANDFDPDDGHPLTIKGFAMAANNPENRWHKQSKAWLAVYHMYPKLKPISDSLRGNEDLSSEFKELSVAFNEFHMKFIDAYKRAQSDVGGATSMSMGVRGE
jgi:hypothetical protein